MVLLTCKYKSLRLALHPGQGLGTQLSRREGWKRVPFRFLRAGAFQGSKAPLFSFLIDELISTSFHQIIAVYFRLPHWRQTFRGGGKTQVDFPVECPLFIYLFILNTLQRVAPSSAPRPTAVTGPRTPDPLSGRALTPRTPRPEPRRRHGRCSRPRAGAAADSVPQRNTPPGTPRACSCGEDVVREPAWAPRSGSGGPPSLQRGFRVIFKRRLGGGLRGSGFDFACLLL